MEATNPDIKAVAFDAGGVVILNRDGDALPHIAQLLDVPLDEFRRAYFERNYLSNVENMKWEDMVIEVVRVFNKDKDMEERVRRLIHEREAARTVNVDLLKLFPDLRRLGLKVAIFSNATSGLRRELEKLNIAPLVDEIVISGEIGYQKPSKEAFDILFKKLDLLPRQVVFIDDTPRSLETAGEIGYIPILFKNNEQLRVDLKNIGIPLG